MKISKYLSYMLKDFFFSFGCLIAVATLLLTLYSKETFSTSLLWQLVLLASVFVFFKYTFVQKPGMGKREQTISFFVNFTMADIMILFWLIFYSPGKLIDVTTILAYIGVLIVVKLGVYWMMYTDGKAQAKQLNDKLSTYKSSKD